MAELSNVKSFDDARGGGVIVADRGEEAAVHFKSILVDGFATLSPGERVSFDLVESSNGLRAMNVVKML